jgi:hypothetical protein
MKSTTGRKISGLQAKRERKGNNLNVAVNDIEGMTVLQSGRQVCS